MDKKRKGYVKTYKSGFVRGLVISLLLLLQFGVILWFTIVAFRYGLSVYITLEIIGIVTIIGLINRDSHTTTKVAWLTLIAIAPMGGLIMYFLWGRDNSTKRIREKNMAHVIYGENFADRDRNKVLERFGVLFPSNRRIARYVESEHFPLYKNNEIDYFTMGEDFFEQMMEDLKQAESFIFISFFIVADGELWSRFKDIIIEKSRAGVEVRFMYDDFGCMLRTDAQFWEELEHNGITVLKFNPMHKYMDKLYLNYRSHQKLVIIDGRRGYTGGVNLADEYVNEVERFGVWKDTGVRVSGDGVYGFTLVFLEMWGMASGFDDIDYERYKVNGHGIENDTYVQLIADGPVNNPDNPIASTFKQIIMGADDYLYITTPYLILEDEFKSLLCETAQSGVDVRIITPGIPDKKAVFLMTRQNYGQLLAAGVKIYEYTPGFIHAKTFATKDKGVVGTINLDYRSLYLHYEDGALIWDEKVMQMVKEDFEQTLTECHEWFYEEWKRRPLTTRIAQYALSLFAALF